MGRLFVSIVHHSGGSSGGGGAFAPPKREREREGGGERERERGRIHSLVKCNKSLHIFTRCIVLLVYPITFETVDD